MSKFERPDCVACVIPTHYACARCRGLELSVKGCGSDRLKISTLGRVCRKRRMYRRDGMARPRWRLEPTEPSLEP